MNLTMSKCCITEFYTEDEITKSQIKINTYQPFIGSYYDYLNFESSMHRFIRNKLVLLMSTGEI